MGLHSGCGANLKKKSNTADLEVGGRDQELRNASLEAGKGEEINFHLEPLEGPANTFVSVQ